MKFETKYFGTVEVPPDEVITFPNGLFGFEEERSFLLLPFAGSDGNMLCLQSAATPSLAFIAMNPFSLHPSYQPLLSSEELREMEVKDSHALCYYVLCVVREPVQESTLNFKCPVVVNPDSRRAIQVIHTVLRDMVPCFSVNSLRIMKSTLKSYFYSDFIFATNPILILPRAQTWKQ